MFARVACIVKRIKTTGEGGDKAEADSDHKTDSAENQDDANNEDEEFL